MNILKKYKENEILTEKELEDINKRLEEIKKEFLELNKGKIDKKYFKKAQALGVEMGRLQKRLQQGLKANRELEERNKK